MINLDDQNSVKEIDTQDALSVALNQFTQLDDDFDVSIDSNGKIENVVLGGIGGSALYAEIFKVWPGLAVPFEIVRDYDIPKYVGESTLFIASSFSGNTEECLSMLQKAEATGASIAVITAGGKLLDIAKEKNYPLAVLDGSIPQPRMATLNCLKALTTILIEAKVIGAELLNELDSVQDFIKKSTSEWALDVPEEHNYAKQIAKKVQGKSMVVYSGNKLRPAANKWKITFNENAKNVAWLNTYPEYNHNEFIGWSSAPFIKDYSVINLIDDIDHPKIRKRFEISDKLLDGLRPKPLNVEVQGESFLEKLLWAFVLGDFVSVYTGVLNGVDPSPVDLVEDLKKELS